jgi:hypothetical protein
MPIAVDLVLKNMDVRGQEDGDFREAYHIICKPPPLTIDT